MGRPAGAPSVRCALAVGIVTGSCLAAGSVTPVPASAVSRSDVSVSSAASTSVTAAGDVLDYTLTGPSDHSLTLGYGSGNGSLPVGADIERLVIEPTTEATGPTVQCSLVTGYNEPYIESREWTAEQWRNGEATFAVDWTRIDLGWANVQCRSGSAQNLWRIGWSLDIVPTAAEVLVLTQDPDLLNGKEVVDRYADSSPPVTVRPGDKA